VAPAAAALAALLYRAFNDVLMAVIGLAVSVVSERRRRRRSREEPLLEQ
jgi:uncharacterized membrane protein YbhN (UPF0104 family)